jgi:cobalt/nickel transport system permease protein
MADMLRKVRELSSLEQLAAGKTLVHRLHPGVKILVTAVFMVTVISFDRYSLGRMVPFLFYPSILIALGELPPALLLRRTSLALPFCLFAGISNCIFERNILFTLGPLGLSAGFLSLATLLLRTLLCVAAVLILIAATPWAELSAQLRRFHIPAIFVTLLEICYRYIALVLTETASMYTAYKLRSGGMKGVAMGHMGSFVGCLFLRSAGRAERVYAAMKCRGYSMESFPPPVRPLSRGDGLFFVLVCSLCIVFRLADIPAMAGVWITGVLPL